jgi:hypothetical protein
VKTPVINLTSAASNRLPRKDCLTGVLLSFVYHKFSAALHCVPLISASSRELARRFTLQNLAGR